MTPSTDAEPAPTEEELCRKIWLLAHSYPAKWVGDLRKPLDARFPTRHNIWTPIWDQMQERVWKEGSRRRLDPCKTLVLNVAPRQNPGSPPNLECPERLRQFQSWLTEYKPPILITFGSVAYRFATRAIAPGWQEVDGFEQLRPILAIATLIISSLSGIVLQICF
jgi:hypothetical protein